ncbi:putative xyloglucan endotransglucosylase/hydrolase protein 5 [Acorus calamus]|uniref:Xyloglucan endotransglucosylase/hydrolase n=1 Tax=Acorus calamus TaxID=4465 RepID=A0AAV9EB44_ACOCL|nr:putative xyloglucan endotransglucosylase/hydrolase protein 5 [Acorus calamus]
MLVSALLEFLPFNGCSPKRAIDVPFQNNYVPTWANDHIKHINGGNEIQLSLDKYTGTGFQSKGSYLFGHFSMHIKMVPGDSAGTVTAFYLSSTNSEHDEIDFEFLGNRTDCVSLFFITLCKIMNIHLHITMNSKDLGVRFPFNQPMKIYSSLWNADDWATRGGLEKTDWSKAPFVASYKGFHIDGCEASAQQKFCATQGRRWWDQKEFQDLDGLQYRKLAWVRQRFTIYNYCTDRSRLPLMPAECRRDRDV